VSDCDSDGDSDSDSDSGSDSDSDTELDSDSGSDDEKEEMEIKTVKLNINSIDEMHDCEIKMDDINSLDDIEVIEVLNISEIIGSISETISETKSEDITVKTISISLESETDKSNNLDYKKMSLDKLRAVVKEKKLCADSSKLKKNELFKLLQVV
jgi:hypothetical protein